MTPKKEAAMVFREIKVGEYVLRFWPSDNGWMCGITPKMMQALAEQTAQVDPCIDGSCSCCWTHLDEQPASKPWQGLTDEQINEFFEGMEPNNGFWLSFGRAIEAKLREKNT